MNHARLCREVERTAGRELLTPADFDFVAEEICRHTRERLSASTLKRIWGYVESAVTPRRSSLDLLARFVGYRSYEAFLKSEGEAQSNEVLGRKLSCRELEPGMSVCLTWPPDRRCVVEYKGDGRFRVVEAENTKLAVGDTFHCHLIVEHEPLLLDGLIHRGAAPVSYVLGKKDGVQFTL